MLLLIICYLLIDLNLLEAANYILKMSIQLGKIDMLQPWYWKYIKLKNYVHRKFYCHLLNEGIINQNYAYLKLSFKVHGRLQGSADLFL